MQSICEGDARNVAWFLQVGADPRPRRLDFLGDAAPEGQLTALARAVLSMNIEGGERVVELLLDGGRVDWLKAEYCVQSRLGITSSEASQLDSNVVTAVHYAAGKGRLSLLEKLLSHKHAPQNVANADGFYGPIATERGGRCLPLHVAALADQGGAVRMLLAHGAELEARDCDGFTALYLASRFGCDAALFELLKHPDVDVDVKTNAGHTPLFLAARYGHVDAVFKLLRAGSSTSALALPSGRRTPRQYAIHKSGKENCDGRVEEQQACIDFLGSVEREGGLARWLANERLEFVKIRARVIATRAKTLDEPTRAFARTSEWHSTRLACAALEPGVDQVKAAAIAVCGR